MVVFYLESPFLPSITFCFKRDPTYTSQSAETLYSDNWSHPYSYLFISEMSAYRVKIHWFSLNWFSMDFDSIGRHLRIVWSRCIFERSYLRDGREIFHKSGCVLKLCVCFVTPVIFIPFEQEIRHLILGKWKPWHTSYDFYIEVVEFLAFTLYQVEDPQELLESFLYTKV